MQSYNFVNLKTRLDKPEVQRVWSLSIGYATPEKLARVVERCRGNAARKLWGVTDGADVLGVAEYYIRDDGTLYICNIAVTEQRRGQGIGKFMIAALHEKYGLPITLETDDDAVDFYRKCGFEAQPFMHAQYGIRRWDCRLCRLPRAFYAQDVLAAAPALLGKLLCRRLDGETVLRRRVTEAEAYRGEDDTACHASRGRTPRNAVLYRAGGVSYVYLCYGMHNLLNIVTGVEGEPQGVLIRGVEGAHGPGRVTKAMSVDRALNAEDVCASGRLWLEDDGFRPARIETAPRVGIAYASAEDRARLWRFFTAPQKNGEPGI